MVKDRTEYFFELVFDYFAKEANTCTVLLHKEDAQGRLYEEQCKESPAVESGNCFYCREHLFEGPITPEDFMLERLQQQQAKNSCLEIRVKALENVKKNRFIYNIEVYNKNTLCLRKRGF